jgi:hypothetical protein
MCCAFSVRLDLGEDVRLAEHQQILAVERDLGAAVLAVEDLVALGDVERDALLAVLVEPALADGDDLALLRLLLGGVGEHDATRGGGLLLDRPHDQPIAQGLQLHVYLRRERNVSPGLALDDAECQRRGRV